MRLHGQFAVEEAVGQDVPCAAAVSDEAAGAQQAVLLLLDGGRHVAVLDGVRLLALAGADEARRVQLPADAARDVQMPDGGSAHIAERCGECSVIVDPHVEGVTVAVVDAGEGFRLGAHHRMYFADVASLAEIHATERLVFTFRVELVPVQLVLDEVGVGGCSRAVPVRGPHSLRHKQQEREKS